MGIITISRELAALGDETAKELAALSGYRFVDKQALEQRIARRGLSCDFLKKFDEKPLALFSDFSDGRERYLHYLKTAMLEEAGEGNSVFIGRGAFAVFKPLAAVLPVFLVSSAPVRLERLKSYFRCDDKKAQSIIARSDNSRKNFHSSFFDTDWRDSANYTLTLNTACLTPKTGAELIDKARRLLFTPDAEAQTAKQLEGLRLAQKVIHHIAYERSIAVHFLDALISGGELKLFGAASSAAVIESAVAAAKEALRDRPDINTVVCEIQLIQDHTLFR